MGNFIATCASIVLPLINHTVVLPFIFYPTRWGIPWYTPNGFVIGAMAFAVVILELMALGTLSGMMNTVKKCGKIDVKQSTKRSLWLVMGYLLGNLILLFMPFLKAPLLIFCMGLPYAGWLVHGVMTAIPVMLFGAMGVTKLLKDVC